MSQRKRRQTPGIEISACMIVRDEEANIGRALASLQGKVDELIVVDTGSQDRTAAIAAAHGARVVTIPWRDDFSAARNESLRHASGRWIIYIDADEELLEAEPGALRRLCGQLRAAEHGACLAVHCPTDAEGLGEVVGEQWRLLRNGQGIHFDGRVHEQLRLPAGEPRLRGATEHGVRLQHWGYVPEGDTLQRKWKRNRRLLELSMAEEPDEPGHWFNLGRECAWEGRYEEAGRALDGAIQLWTANGQPATGYAPSMFSTAALAALKQEQWARVLDVEQLAPAGMVSAELLYVSGMACANLGRDQDAIRRLNRAWQDRSLAQASGSDPSAAGWRPLAALAEVHHRRGDSAAARAALEHALRLSPEQPALQALATRFQPLVSVCMIVRDEEHNLRRWLPRVVAAADEVIVVDTGSQDGTAIFAEELGARVYHFPWVDDFSAARNESLRHATGQWILWQDADDELVESAPGALRQMCESIPADVHGCWVEVDSTPPGSTEQGAILRQWRLFRNGLGIRFHGRVHEQPRLPQETGSPRLLNQEQVRVRHWGYASDPAGMQRKLARNLHLLELSMAEEPDQPLHRYSLAKQHLWQGDYPQALDWASQAVEDWRAGGQVAYGYVAPMFAVAACAALNVGSPEQALELAAGCPSEAVSSDLLYYAGIACVRTGRHQDAMAYLRRAIDDPTVRQATETDPATSTWQPRLLLAQILAKQGRREEAYRLIMEAIETMPDRADVLLGAAAMAAQLGQCEDASRICQRLLAADVDEAAKATARQTLAGIGSQPNTVATLAG
ncbi:MAG TPA: glycosyltransferase [Chloroflexota bacterium]